MPAFALSADCFAIACRAMDGFQVKRIIDNWIEFYNSERPHTALDKRTPDIAYFGHAEIRKAA
jgi:putative transposase